MKEQSVTLVDPVVEAAAVQNSAPDSLIHAHLEFEENAAVQRIEPVAYRSPETPVAWLTGSIEPITEPSDEHPGADLPTSLQPRIKPTVVTGAGR